MSGTSKQSTTCRPDGPNLVMRTGMESYCLPTPGGNKFIRIDADGTIFFDQERQ